MYTTANGTNYVSRWKDISGHGNDATASSGPKQKPMYRTVHLDAENVLADSGRAISVIDFGEYYNYEQLGITDLGRVQAGYRANLALLDDQFGVAAAFIDGQRRL